MHKLFVSALLASCCLSAQAQRLNDQFMNPPQEAQPRVWWHWMNGNITEDGIRKDLLWMKNSGIAGFHNFDAGLMTPQIVEKRLEYMTPEWKHAFHRTAQLADSLNLEMTIASAPGWSATGGPWVKPEDAMKKLAWSEKRIQGGSKKAQTYSVPAATTSTGMFQAASGAGLTSMLSGTSAKPVEYYQDIAILAVRMPEADRSMLQMGAKATTAKGEVSAEVLSDGNLTTSVVVPRDDQRGYCWVQYEFPAPQTIKSVSVVTGRVRGEWEAQDPEEKTSLWASNDGRNFYQVCMIPDGSVAQQTIDIPVTTARYFQLRMPNPVADNSYAAFTGVVMPDPDHIDLSQFVLHGVNRINHFEEKTGWAATHDVERYPTPQVEASEIIAKNEVIDLTALVDAEGNFTYQFPAGDWKIYRIGYSLTGKTNHPASPEATGLEVDKMDPDAWHRYFTTYLDMYKDASGGLMGSKGVQYLMLDSYEAGSMTWTPRMKEQFEKRRGYSLIPWMPVLLGQIVGSVQESEAFLWDWRKTCSELIAEGYDRVSEIAQKEYGMKGRYTESHENGRLYLVDGMDVKRRSEVPMSAIWWPTPHAGSTLPMALADIRESASVAHIFGQNIVAAESFTTQAMGNENAWSFHPGKLKWLVDQEFANGLNRVVVHTSPHQPDDVHKPGLGLMIFGQWFTRHDTWADYAKVWTDYISRSSYLLQQGKFVADVLYYYGEDNNICGLFGWKAADIPAGYNYDFCNPSALLEEVSAQNQDLVTRTGMKYRVLVLDKNCRRMSLPVLRKIAQLAEQGVTIYGQKPQMCASLTDDQQEWNRLVEATWSRPNVSVAATYNSLENVLQAKGVQPDFQPVTKGLDVQYVHRQTADADIYWVKNPVDQPIALQATFRVYGKKPHIYHPETGAVEDCSYEMKDGVTTVTLNMTPEDAQFVVFEEPTQQLAVTLPVAEEHTWMKVDGPWQVAFQEGRGAPATATFDTLVDWKDHADKGIKYFSGQATYTKTIELNKKQLENTGTLLLDLGQVAVMAEVFVNGKSQGVVWKSPFKLDVTAALQPGKNDIRVVVTNLWVNRLIGDQQPDVQEKISYTTMPFYSAASKLLPSGLIGPVRLVEKK